LTKPAKLVLSGGISFTGVAPESQKDSLIGETVFNTGMTGYVETLTDPSYAGQILVFTYPLIGNYGVPSSETWESSKVHLRGVVISELAIKWSHEGSLKSLYEWLNEQNVPLITGVDTRALTKYLRTRGTMAGVITSSEDTPAPQDDALKTVKVSITEPEIINPGKSKTVVAVDCGMKQNIVRELVKLGVTVKRVPHDYDYTSETYDGVFISNGPGDPTDYPETIAILKKALAADKPVFGICLGTQLMGLAAGATTYKLRFGHRGHNQPAIMDGGRGYITSQNHGYAIAEDSLPEGWHITFRNLNDNSVEGIAHDSKPFFSVQFHPEATPGPTDTNFLFKDFLEML
jgi:carbamoyl-phosphate synthase small subunit